MHIVIWMLGCAGSESDPLKEPTESTDSDEPDEPEEFSYDRPESCGVGVAAVDVEESVVSLEGTTTWSVDFDATLEEQGDVDCVYTRTYTGWEDRSMGHLCPDCEMMFRVDTTMTDGREDCYAQISTADPAPIEFVGYGGGVWYRHYYENIALTEQGTAVVSDGSSILTSNFAEVELDEGGSYSFEITGSFDVATIDADPLHGLTPPTEYAHGWPQAAPEAYGGDYRLEIGATIPDAWLPDQCGDSLRLHDFEGVWFVLDVAAVDCPPCRDMAEDEPDFLATMREAGVDVRVVTLLRSSLSDGLETTPTATLMDWVDTFDVHDPVVADRGYGYWVVGTAMDEWGGGFGYPSWVVVDPELTAVATGVGYGGWDPIAEAILDRQ